MSFLSSLGLIFLSGLFLGSIVQKLKLPRLIGMLFAGIIIGPYALNLLGTSILEISSDLRQLALIIILTRAGLSLELDDLKKIGRPAVLMSFLPAVFEIAGVTLLSIVIFNLSLIDAIILGTVLASSSPAVIVPRMINLIEKGYGTAKRIPQLILAGDSIDDIFNIVLFTAFISLSLNKNENIFFKFTEIPLAIISGIIGGIIVGYFLSIFFKKVSLNNVVKVIILLSVGFFLILIEEKLENIIPFSGLLAIMVIGITILKKSPTIAENLSKNYSKLWIVAEIVLFVLVGAGVNINYISNSIFNVIIMLGGILLIRAVGIMICLINTNLNFKERLFCMLTGIPKATVQAAIGAIPLSLGLASGELILTVAVISILVTAPLGAFLLDISYQKLLSYDKRY